MATSPAYRSRAGSSGSLQAGSRLVAYFFRRPLFAFWSTSCDRRSSRVPLRDFRWARDPSRHRLSDPTGRASESEGYVRAGVFRCSSPENLVAMGPAIVMAGRAFGVASTPPESRAGRLPSRYFLAWCTQFQITHVFLEAVPVLHPSGGFKTCESIFDVAPRARRLRGTASPSAFDASSFSRGRTPPIALPSLLSCPAARSHRCVRLDPIPSVEVDRFFSWCSRPYRALKSGADGRGQRGPDRHDLYTRGRPSAACPDEQEARQGHQVPATDIPFERGPVPSASYFQPPRTPWTPLASQTPSRLARRPARRRRASRAGRPSRPRERRPKHTQRHAGTT